MHKENGRCPYFHSRRRLNVAYYRTGTGPSKTLVWTIFELVFCPDCIVWTFLNQRIVAVSGRASKEEHTAGLISLRGFKIDLFNRVYNG